MTNVSYERCLTEYGLTPLETRRLRGDQIEVFFKLNGYKILIELSSSNLKKAEHGETKQH